MSNGFDEYARRKLPQMLKKVKEDAIGAKIQKISFELLSARNISSISVHAISTKDLYDVQTRTPLADGPLDLRLGVGNKRDKCATCNEGLVTCVGHFGEIKLTLPVFSIGLIKQTISALSCLCKNCACVLLDNRKKIYFRKKMRECVGRNDMVLLQRKILSECRKVSVCFTCSAKNGPVKKGFGFKIIHEAGLDRRKKGDDEGKGKGNVHLHSGEDLNPQVALNIFKMTKEEDYELLGLSVSPERFIVQNVIVPPSCIRPSVSMDDEGTNEDDITIKISEIVHTNKLLRDGIEKGNPLSLINEDWDHLQLQCALLINSELPQVGIPGQSVRGMVQRLKGKGGRFRCNLSGKRVDFSGRTVISPDPNLSIEEVGMPEHMAKVLTIPEKVTRFNKEKLQALVLNGPENHPGANYIAGEKFRRFLLYGKRDVELKEGEVVERHIMDGDLVLFNRQPSLHRMSIMAHRTRIHKNRTLRFNECVCAPYNADFDGDEMNVHVPQTERAQAEASVLMSVANNIVTPRHGEPIIAATQDFITGLYLITGKDTFFDRERFGQLVSYFAGGRVRIRPAICRPIELFTGKQLVEALIVDSLSDVVGNTGVSLVGTNRSFKGHEDQNDGDVVILDSSYYFGRLDKSIVGGENKKDSLFYAIMKIDNAAAVKAMNGMTKLCSRYLGEVGFSIGLNDVQPGPILQRKKDEVVKEGYFECNKKIVEYIRAGRMDEETLEMEISSVLNQIREKCGSICMKELSAENSANTMQTCGSKGSKINVSQMVACVGQQIVSGTRIPSGMDDRCIPHFERGSRSPQSRGFVLNSFFSGLSPSEFFFHAVSGREGLVDTAVKTAETGYMQRRLMKALEDLSVQYDGSVRNSSMEIVQFVYGEDQVDPVMVESEDLPINLERVFLQAKSIFTNKLCDGILVPDVTRTDEERVYDSLRAFLLDVPIAKHVTNRRFMELLWHFIQSKDGAMFYHNNISHCYFQDTGFLSIFLSLISSKIQKLIVEPGTTVGAIAGQSIGEPGTQMTLKTFHFAGVASMNITLGVPRLKEIINAVRNISTPIISGELEVKDLLHAEKTKGRLDRILLKDICSSVSETISTSEVGLNVHIDLPSVSRLRLDLDIHKINRALNLQEQSKVLDSNTIRITMKRGNEQSYFMLQRTKKKVLNTRISGVASVNRVIINSSRGVHSLVVEGLGLLDVINTEGVNASNTISNSITETEAVLGIEAARSQIIHEIEYTISNHGIRIDPRHVMLLADTMTFKGEVFGITRFGISKMSESTLMLASFEQTSDYLFEAAVHSKTDSVRGVSESIILGIPISIGTGCIDLYWK